MMLKINYLNFDYQDWLEKHNRSEEAAFVPVTQQPKVPPENPNLTECRLCEEFPGFQKVSELHRHLSECHFRMEISNQLPQVCVLHLFMTVFCSGGRKKYYLKVPT